MKAPPYSSLLFDEEVCRRMAKPGRRRRKKSRKARPVFSKGQVNRLIDDAIHPLKKMDSSFTIIDEALHMINEGDIQQSIIKFVEYSLPEILRKFLKKK